MKRVLFSILITVGIISVLFTQISLRDLYALMINIDPLWATLGAASYFLAILFQALRYKWLIHSKDISINELFRISVFYNLLLMVLPSRLGEFSYPYFLNKISGVNMTEGLASLIASRVYDFFIILMIFIFASVGFQSLFRINLLMIIFLSIFLIGLVLLVFLHLSRLLRFFSNILERILQWTGREDSKPFHWVQRKIHEMAEDLHAIKAKGTYFSVTLTSLISWIMAFLTFYAFVRGFGIEISFWKVVFASTVALITNALPIGGLGNWGTLEVGWTAGFLMMGLSKEKAIASGFGVHILIFIICAIFGFISWVTLKR